MKTFIQLLGTFMCSGVLASDVSTHNSGLMLPPALSAREVALADTEMVAMDSNEPKVVFASEYDQKSEDTVSEADAEAAPYFELSLTHKRGKDAADNLRSVSAYAEIPVTEDISVWATASDDSAARLAYAGVLKKVGNWSLAVGGGTVTYGGSHHTVFNPWVYYSSDQYEGNFSMERYSNEPDDPWYYEGYVEKKFNAVALGVYGEKGLGFGPRVSYRTSKNMKVWMTVPVTNRPETSQIKFLFGFIFSF